MRYEYITKIEIKFDKKKTFKRKSIKYLQKIIFQESVKLPGHPLFNDERYDGAEIRKGTIYAKYRQFIENCFKLLPRQALHAKTLGFVHPKTKQIVRFDSQLPSDMQALIDKWRKYSENMTQFLEED